MVETVLTLGLICGILAGLTITATLIAIASGKFFGHT